MSKRVFTHLFERCEAAESDEVAVWRIARAERDRIARERGQRGLIYERR